MQKQRRKKDPKMKSIDKELVLVAKLYERKSDTRELLHRLQQSSLEKIAQHSQDPDEFEPLPKYVGQTLEKHNSALKREQQNFSREKYVYKH
jgi:hypothetical protein